MSQGVNRKKAVKKYWKEQTADLKGIMDMSRVANAADLRATGEFLELHRGRRFGLPRRACRLGSCIDLGAGIGRVTGGVLLKRLAGPVDVLEPAAALRKVAYKKFGKHRRIGRFHASSIQAPKFGKSSFDVFFCQTVLMYLSDKDLVAALGKVASAMEKTSILVLKENVGTESWGKVGGRAKFEFDEEDGSTTRSAKHFLQLFDKVRPKVRVLMTKTYRPTEALVTSGETVFPDMMWSLVLAD